MSAYKATVRLAAAAAHSGPPLDGPLWVSLLFVLPRPGSMVWKKKPMPRVPHDRTPDLDNMVKSTLDALNKLLWRDDGLLATVVARKVFAGGDESPRVEIEVHEHETGGKDDTWE